MWMPETHMLTPTRMRSKTIPLHLRFLVRAFLVLGVLSAFLHVLGYPSYSSAQEADGTNCPSGVTGLCTPGVFESSTETVTETTETDATGTTTTTTTTTETTETTVTNPETGDLLTDQKVQEMGRNQKFGGDMTSDWGGQGSAKIRNGVTCGLLGTDKCAEITGGGSFTSTLGQQGVGSTYIQHINMSSIDPDIERGGQVPWSIRVEKRDANDSIHFRIRKSDGTTTTLLGSETLSSAGDINALTNTLFQGNFSFSGAVTTLSIEVSGRDVNLGIGPLFDDVTVNVIYNVVSTIVTETITTVEEFVALGIFDQETIDVATDIFNNNDIGQNDLGEVTIEPVGPEPQGQSASYESVEMEMNTEMSMPDIKMEMDLPPPPVEVQTSEQNVEVEIEMEMQNDINDNVASATGPDSKPEPSSEGGTNKSDTTTEEPKPEPEGAEGQSEASENSEEGSDTESSSVEKPKSVAKAEKKDSKPKTKTEKKQEAKQKAATKIVKKMGDKGRYDDANQMKTLVVMQVLGDTKSFFNNQAQLQDTPGFFDSTKVPDAQISDNNIAAYFMIGGSDAKMDALTDLQYK